jgi:hypothetical protein
MRKRLISANPRDRVSSGEGGLDLANLGMVEIRSEDEAYPIECALQLGERRGWRAAKPGPQIIRLLFDHCRVSIFRWDGSGFRIPGSEGSAWLVRCRVLFQPGLPHIARSLVDPQEVWMADSESTRQGF